jgi:predicted transglutaminase-like cysteine proteinase
VTDLNFAGYRSLNASIGDPYRKKWDAVRGLLDLPTAETATHAYCELPGTTLAEIARCNSALNHTIVYTPEPDSVDVWQTPAQTLSLNRGDCEDCAILKYALLTKAGIPARVVIGEIKNILANQPHAWCAAFLDGEWRALDNKFDKIIKIEDYMNWLPMAAMHDDKVVRFGREFVMDEMIGSRHG